MNVGATFCQSTIKIQLWSIPTWWKTKGAVCFSRDWRGTPSRKWGIRRLGILETEAHSFIYEAFLGQFWADARDAKVNWPCPLAQRVLLLEESIHM